MRMSNVASAAGSPIASLDSDDMACSMSLYPYKSTHS
jgi:hypothetical protein